MYSSSSPTRFEDPVNQVAPFVIGRNLLGIAKSPKQFVEFCKSIVQKTKERDLFFKSWTIGYDGL